MQYQTVLEKSAADAFRPTNVESYLRCSQELYAFTAVKHCDHASIAPMTASQRPNMRMLVTQLKAQGSRPIASPSWRPGGTARYTAHLGAARPRCVAVPPDVPTRPLPAVGGGRSEGGREARRKSTRTLRGGVPSFSAITTSKSTLRLARHNLTSAQLQTEFDAALKRGWRTLAITAYPTGTGMRYAALWG